MEPRIGGLAALGILVGLVATFLYFGFLELSKFTGGQLLKLEDVYERLADRLDSWMPLSNMFLSSARLWMIVSWGVYAWIFGMLVSGMPAGMRRLCWGLGGLVGGVGAICLAETLAPRTSLRGTAKLLCFYLPLFNVLRFIAYPLVKVISLIGERGESAGTGDQSESSTAEDEILSLIMQNEDSESEDGGIEEDERRMITGALALDDKSVHEIMTPRVDIDAVEMHSSLDDIRSLIVKSGHSRIPIYDETVDKIRGIISAKDLLNVSKVQQAAKGGLVTVCREPLFVPETKNIGDLLNEFQTKNTHFAVVIDEYGGTSGIVTFEDILEEVVGEIWDEYDVPVSEVVADTAHEGWFLLDGRTPIGEVNEKLDADLPEDEDYDTFGGYLSSEAGHIPQAGERVETELLEAEILQAEPRFIKRARVRIKDDRDVEESREEDRNGKSKEQSDD